MVKQGKLKRLGKLLFWLFVLFQMPLGINIATSGFMDSIDADNPILISSFFFLGLAALPALFTWSVVQIYEYIFNDRTPNLRDPFFKGFVALILSGTILFGIGMLLQKPNEPVQSETLSETVFEAIDQANNGVWDEKVDVVKINETEDAVYGHWYHWDQWYWLAWKDDQNKWNVAVDRDGFQCAQLDQIPQRYNVFFREVIYPTKSQRRCH